MRLGDGNRHTASGDLTRTLDENAIPTGLV
jgi:hypothetical protein